MARNHFSVAEETCTQPFLCSVHTIIAFLLLGLCLSPSDPLPSTTVSESVSTARAPASLTLSAYHQAPSDALRSSVLTVSFLLHCCRNPNSALSLFLVLSCRFLGKSPVVSPLVAPRFCSLGTDCISVSLS